MGLDWGFYLKNKKTKEKVYLINFCGWNSSDILRNVREYCELDGDTYVDLDGEVCENTDCYWNCDSEKLMNYLKEVAKVRDIFAGVSDRVIDSGDFDEKTQEAYADYCYDIGIQYDDIIVFTLLRLADFYRFLDGGDVFTNENWELGLYQSY